MQELDVLMGNIWDLLHDASILFFFFSGAGLLISLNFFFDRIFLSETRQRKRRDRESIDIQHNY